MINPKKYPDFCDLCDSAVKNFGKLTAKAPRARSKTICFRNSLCVLRVSAVKPAFTENQVGP
jgi:hypothetical protein